MANIVGITSTAQSKILTALNDYNSAVSKKSYSLGPILKYVRGTIAEKEATNVINSMIREVRYEIEREIDAIEQITTTLNSTYSKMDANTSFKKS